MFSNVRQEIGEFTCSEFSIIVDKQNRRIKLNFQSNLDVTKDSVTGYQETIQEFLHSSMCDEDGTVPYNKDLSSSVPVSEKQ